MNTQLLKRAEQTEMKDIGGGRVEIVCARCGQPSIKIKGNAKNSLATIGKIYCSHKCSSVKHGQARRGAKTKTYECWENMLSRCNNKNNTSYADYGGRGITICDRWHDFELFRLDMGDQPPRMRLDRIDNENGYFKDNCRWTSCSVQAFNQRLRSTNKTGIVGVTFDASQNVFKALAIIDGVRLRLYRGNDFFEACCRRLSWEAQVDNKQLRGRYV